jgi:UDP-N-acetylglucosamine 3-dehydrogenase
MLRVGVIGVGSMGQNHARVYSEIADLIGVHDAIRESSRRVAERFGVGSFENLDDLLDRVDVISVCTPTSYHFDVAKKVMSKGISLLVEKPFTGKSKEADELGKLAEKKGVTLASGFIERFNPIVSVARDAVREGRLGKVISISSRRVSSFPSRIRDVGVIMDLGIHDVDVIRHITASEVISVYAVGGRYQNTSFEDHANIVMEMGDGTIGLVEVNWLTPMKVRKVTMTCSAGYAQLDYTDQSMELSSAKVQELDPSDMFHIPLEYDLRRVSVKKEEPLKRELSDFLDAVEKGRAPYVTATDAAQNLKVCEAAMESLRIGAKIKL